MPTKVDIITNVFSQAQEVHTKEKFIMYLLTDDSYYIGKDFHNRPMIVMDRAKAAEFKNELAALNYLKSIPETLKLRKWQICSVGDGMDNKDDIAGKVYGNITKTTVLEEENFDICDFFTKTIKVMSQLERFIFNMQNNEQVTDMKILDVRHYIRDNEHKLNAIQMQRLGYFLQGLEKERYGYKSKRVIASMFVNSLEELKNTDNIEKMYDVLESKYKPRILEDEDIEEIINKKKDEEISA